jgi:FkbM family methyltransferase
MCERATLPRLKTLRKIGRKLNALRRRAEIERNIGRKEVCDRVKHLFACDVLIEVKEFDGEFYVDPRSDLLRRILYSGRFEPELASIAVKFMDPNKDIIDVGANIGFYAVLLAKRLNDRMRVAALEPDNEAFERLLRSIDRNQIKDKVLALPCAASDAAGQCMLFHVDGRSEYSSLNQVVHPSVADESTTSQKALAMTIDEIVSRHVLCPGFMKIDVEGAEHLVLAGAKRTIQSCRPIVLMEVSDQLLRSAGSSARSLVDSMRMHDYVVVDPVKPKLNPGSRAFGDVICFPKEDDRWQGFFQQ